MRQEYELSIITINYNGLKDTCELLGTLPLENDSLEVIVVDNASRKDEATVIEQRYPQVKVIRSPQNVGFAGGNNLGIREARGSYIFLVNNDTVFKEWNVSALIHRLASSPQIGAVCPKIRFTWDNCPIQFAGYTPLSPITMRNRSIGFGEDDQGQYDMAHPTPYAHGAAMMVKREVIDKAGMMPECYFLYYEELDWSMMISRAGYDIWYEPRCTIYHKESQTTGQQSPLKTYYLTRNRLLFAHRNSPLRYRYLTYLYLLTAVALRDACKYLVIGKWALLKAVGRGVYSFIRQ